MDVSIYVSMGTVLFDTLLRNVSKRTVPCDTPLVTHLTIMTLGMFALSFFRNNNIKKVVKILQNDY